MTFPLTRSTNRTRFFGKPVSPIYSQTGPTLDLVFAGIPTDPLGAATLTDYTLNTDFTYPQYQIAEQYTVWEDYVGLVSKTFSQIITFTRASTATYFDATGTLQSAAIDAPRFDYDPATLAARGLLIEEARTNLLTYSEDLTDAAWTKSEITVTANSTTAPSGAVTADTLTPSTNNAGHTFSRLGIITGAGTFTDSIFVKANGYSFLLSTADTGGNATFNVSTGVVVSTSGGATATIQSVGNGWYRCSTTRTITGAASLQYQIRESSGVFVYAGDGTSGLFIWGAQLEAGAFPTSYIPTTTTALTRSADVASVNTLSPWFNQTTGTLYAEGILVGGTASTFPSMVTLAGSNANTDITGIVWTAASGDMRWSVRAGGVSQANISVIPAKSAGSTFKVAGRYATNDFQLASDGNLGTQDTSGTVPTITSLLLGGPASFQPGANVWLRRVTFYPRGLANAELQSITS